MDKGIKNPGAGEIDEQKSKTDGKSSSEITGEDNKTRLVDDKLTGDDRDLKDVDENLEADKEKERSGTAENNY